ncbi:MAG: hypothetical protein J6X44_05715 [Thermoguttaceae bacterium]|nr:hypothetical protein [Thermoguttaceae bacterium]
MDNSNGASISARELLLGLKERGWNVKTLCGPLVDNHNVSDVFNVLRSRGFQANAEIQEKGEQAFTVYSFNDCGIRSVVFCTEKYSYVPRRATGELFLSLFASSLARTKPDLIITYGGSWLAAKILRVARKARVKSVFLLQNFAYNDKKLFELVDTTIVPSQYASDLYKRRLGITMITILLQKIGALN